MLNTAVSRRALLRAAATGAASATAVALVGCGGDDAGTLPTAVRPSPTEAPLTEASTPASSSSARWSQVARSATHPPALRDMSLTLGTNGKIYMFGGRAAGVASNATWEFDPPAASWREIMAQGASPEARFGHNAWFDVARNRLVIALGQGDGSAFFDDVWSLSPASEIWTQLDASSAERPEKRYGAAGAYDPSGDRLVISHGFTSRGRAGLVGLVPSSQGVSRVGKVRQSGFGASALGASGSGVVYRVLSGQA